MLREYLLNNLQDLTTPELINLCRITGQGSAGDVTAGLESLERAGLARRDGDVWARVYVKVVEVVKVKQMEMFA